MSDINLPTNIRAFLRNNKELIDKYRDHFDTVALTPKSSKVQYELWKARAKGVRAMANASANASANQPPPRPKLTIRYPPTWHEERQAEQLGRLATSPTPLPPKPQHIKKVKFQQKETRALGAVTIVTFEPENITIPTLEQFALYVEPAMLAILRRQLLKHNSIKVHLKAQAIMEKLDEAQESQQHEAVFPAGSTQILNKQATEQDLIEFIRKQVEYLYDTMELYNERGTGFTLKQINAFDLSIYAYQPLRGSSYIPLPLAYQQSKHVVNMENTNDNKCFLWAVTAQLYYEEELKKLRKPILDQALTVNASLEEIKASINAIPPLIIKNRGRIKKVYREYATTLNLRALTFPVPCNDKRMLERFQKDNNLTLNIFQANMKNSDTKSRVNPTPLYITSSTQTTDLTRHVNLLFIPADDEEDTNLLSTTSQTLQQIGTKPITGVGHYALITDFNALMFSYSNHNSGKIFCQRCFAHFPKTQPERLTAHIQDGYCQKQDAITTVFPKLNKDDTCSFKHFKNTQKNPYIIYADFESLIAKNEKGKLIHENMSWGALLVSATDQIKSTYLTKRRTTETDQEWRTSFMDALFSLDEQVQKYIRINIPMKLTPQEEEEFQHATSCHICEKPILPNQETARDHDHFTGQFRGATHKACNLNYNLANYKIPVVFHSGKTYDFHYIIKNLTTDDPRTQRKSVIASNTEKFMSMQIGHFKFIDSYSFLNVSLESLIRNIGSNPQDFPQTCTHFNNDPNLHLLIGKGLYPYEYIDSLDRMKETELPPQDKFFSTLTHKSASNADYQHALQVWKAFKCQTFGDYHDIYLKTDVCFLADVFERFRTLCLQDDHLDPSWYISLPSYSWDCALRQTKVELSLFTDDPIHEGMYLFVEDAIRGGMSVITKRHATANNPYLTTYNPNLPSKYLLYTDANNLYGDGMCRPLPTGGFKWEDPTAFTPASIQTLQDEADRGYIFQVDLDYPSNLHDLHNDLPLCPLPQTAPFLSPYAEQLKLSTYKPQQKLLATLSPRVKYTTHYRNLKLYLEQGMVLTKIHKVLSFNQSRWLQPYILSNTEKRAKAKNAFEKDFYKLKNNAVYGKTLENVRGHMNYRIITDPTSALKAISKPNFKRATIIQPSTDGNDDGMLGVELTKDKVELDKPIYCGFTILEHSKHLMFDFHYNTIKKRYGTHAQLLMTDTDSLFYEIQTPDIYKDMESFLDKLDTADYLTPDTNRKTHTEEAKKQYSEESELLQQRLQEIEQIYQDDCKRALTDQRYKLLSKTNNKVIGKFKDETNGHVINEFCGLRAKMYSFQMDRPDLDPKKHQKAKGLKTRTLTHDSYKRCLLDQVSERIEIVSIRSHNHEVETLTQSKAGLSAFDDKRYILPNGVETLAYGHYKIPPQ